MGGVCGCLSRVVIAARVITIVQVVTQLQQDVITLNTQVADQTRLAETVRATNKLATAHFRKDTPSLIDVKGFGRPKEFTGKEEDLQQWSKRRKRSLLRSPT